MGKIYLYLVSLILSLILVFGFVAPWLVSAKSNEAVILGVIVVIAYIYGLIVFIPKFFKTIKIFIDEKNKQK